MAIFFQLLFFPEHNHPTGYNSQSNGMTLVDCSHSSAEGNLSNNPFNSDAVTSVEDESSGAGSVMSSLFSVVAIVFLL